MTYGANNADLWPDSLSQEFGWSERPKLTKFEHGQSNPTYLVEFSNRRIVLRKKPSGDLLPTAHDINREYVLLTALARAGFSSPRPIGLCLDKSVVGTEFYLMEFVPGRIFPGLQLSDEASPELRRRVLELLISALVTLHRIDFRAVGLSEFGRHDRYFERQVKRWTTQYRASETRHIGAIEWLIDWLANQTPSTESSAIIHGDYRIDNVIFDDVGTRVAAVIDWELSTIGHPLADVAYFLLPLVMPIELDGILDRVVEGIPSVAECLDMYGRLGGCTDSNDITKFMVLAIFRRAAILQGIMSRYQSGNASSINAAKRGALAEPVAEVGRRIAQLGIPSR